MTDKYKDLRDALAAGPTPGPWKANTKNEIGPISREDDQSFGMVLSVAYAEHENGEANRRYIAAAHPETIRSLLAERDDLLAQHHTDSKTLREYAQQRDALRNSLQGAANFIDTLGGDSKSYRIALAQLQGEKHDTNTVI